MKKEKDQKLSIGDTLLTIFVIVILAINIIITSYLHVCYFITSELSKYQTQFVIVVVVMSLISRIAYTILILKHFKEKYYYGSAMDDSFVVVKKNYLQKLKKIAKEYGKN